MGDQNVVLSLSSWAEATVVKAENNGTNDEDVK